MSPCCVNPANPPITEATLRDIPEAARAIGLQIQVLNASTSREIEAAFATIVRDRADALFVAPDGFFTSRRSQFVTLAARDRIPTICSNREMVEAGRLMSYGTDNLDDVSSGRRLCRSNPQGREARRPAGLQSTKFELVINLQTARALGLEVPNSLLARRRGDRMKRRAVHHAPRRRGGGVAARGAGAAEERMRRIGVLMTVGAPMTPLGKPVTRHSRRDCSYRAGKSAVT